MKEDSAISWCEVEGATKKKNEGDEISWSGIERDEHDPDSPSSSVEGCGEGHVGSLVDHEGSLLK